MAKIKSLRVKGLFSFGEEVNVNFGDKNLIIGANNSGKTNVYRVFHIIIDALTDMRNVKRDIKTDKESDRAEIETKLEISSEEATILAKYLFLGQNTKENQAHFEKYNHLCQNLAEDFKKLTIKIEFNDEDEDGIASIMTIKSKSFLFYKDYNYGVIQISTKKIFSRTNSFTNNSYFYELLDEMEPKPKHIEEIKNYFDRNEISLALKQMGNHKLHPHEHKFYNTVKQTLNIDSNNKMTFIEILGLVLKNSIKYVSEKRDFKLMSLENAKKIKEDASNLTVFLHNLKNGQNTKQFDEIKEQFSNIFAKKMEFDILQDITNDESGTIKVTPYLIFQKNESIFKYDQVGFGVLEVLFLLTISRTQKNSIVLMDEPTLHLHPSQSRLTFDAILKNVKNSESQLFTITHSTVLPYAKFLSSKNDEILYVRMHDKYTSISQPSVEEREGLMKKMPKLEYDLNPEIFFGKSVILFEGDTELGLIQGIDERKNQKASLNDVVFLPVDSKDNFPTYVELLKAFNIPFTIFADKDAITELKQRGKTSSIIEVLKIIDNELVEKLFTELGEDVIDKTKQPNEYHEKYFEKLSSFAESKNIFIIKEGRTEEILKKIDEKLQEKLKKEFGKSTRLYTKYFIRKLEEGKIKQLISPIKAYEKALEM